jgi:hypothetical protein
VQLEDHAAPKAWFKFGTLDEQAVLLLQHVPLAPVPLSTIYDAGWWRAPVANLVAEQL